MNNEARTKAGLIRGEITRVTNEKPRGEKEATPTGEDEARRETPPSLDVERIIGPLMLKQRQAAG